MKLYDVFYRGSTCDFSSPLPPAEAGIDYAVCTNGESETLRPVRRDNAAEILDLCRSQGQPAEADLKAGVLNKRHVTEACPAVREALGGGDLGPSVWLLAWQWIAAGRPVRREWMEWESV